jgi:heterodisulfide reductase subunit B
MKYAYYPGCSIHSSAKEYEISLFAVTKFFDIELEEIKKWTCCLPVAGHAVSTLLSIAMPVSDLVKPEQEGHFEMVVPCAACFSRFKTAVHEIDGDEELHEKINKIVGYEFKNQVKILHPLELFVKKIDKRFIKKELVNINVVSYYGCLLTRPPKVKQFDDAENPEMMDDILRDIGMNVLDWSYKTDCCGAAYTLPRKSLVMKLTKSILDNAKEIGADCISVACPLCHFNLDSVQWDLDGGYNMPIFYFTQLLGLAFGLNPEELGLKRHLIKSDDVLNKMVGK